MEKKLSLNPCFNGRYSQRLLIKTLELWNMCLNPCFNGRYSQSQRPRIRLLFAMKGLNPCFNGRYSQSEVKIRTNLPKRS